MILALLIFAAQAQAVPTLPVPEDGVYRLTFSYPVARAVAGDFNGDGILDFVMKSEAVGSGNTYRLEARLHDGTKLWEFDTRVYPGVAYSPHEIPLLAWDFDGDGRWEVYFQYLKNGDWWHRMVSGMTGAILADAPLPGWDSRKSMAAVAYRDGRPRIVWVLDRTRAQMFETWNGGSFSLKQLWDYSSDRVAHDMIRVADVDQNGSDDEILLGCATLNSDGRERYSLDGCGGADQVLLGFFHPSQPQRLVAVSGDANGSVSAYWADTGQRLWSHPMPSYFSRWTHFHTGWLKNEGSGAKLLIIDRDTPNWMYLEVKTGSILDKGASGAPGCSGRPIKWDGDDYDDCADKYGELGRIDVGGPGCEEVWEKEGQTLTIEFNTACPANTPSRWANRHYRQDGILSASGYAPYWLGGLVIGNSDPPLIIEGDLNGDGRVDVLDLGILLSNWGPSTSSGPADVNQDGKVDVVDLGILLSHWG